LYIRNNLPACINPKKLDSDLILQGIFEDLQTSKDPALAVFQSPAKEIPVVATPAGPDFFAPVAAVSSVDAIAAARVLAPCHPRRSTK
jgi:hypothetical protein